MILLPYHLHSNKAVESHLHHGGASIVLHLPSYPVSCLLQRRSLIGRSSNDNKAGDACGLSNPNNWARLVLKCHAWSCVKVVDSAEIV